MKSAIILCFAKALATISVTIKCDTVTNECVEPTNSEPNVWPGCGVHGSVACPASGTTCPSTADEFCQVVGGVNVFVTGDGADAGHIMLPGSSVTEHDTLTCDVEATLGTPLLGHCATWYEYRDPTERTEIYDPEVDDPDDDKAYIPDPRDVDEKWSDLRCVGASFNSIYNNESFTFDCTAQNPCPVAIRSYSETGRSEPFSTIGCGACIRFLHWGETTEDWTSLYGRVVTYTDIGLIQPHRDELVGHYPPRDVVILREGMRTTDGGGAGDHAFHDIGPYHVMAYLSNECEEDVITVGCSSAFDDSTFAPCTDSKVSTDATCTSEDPCPISVLDDSIACGTVYTHAVGDGSNVHYTVTHHHSSSDSSIWVPEIYVKSDGWIAAGQVTECDHSVLGQNFKDDVYFFKYVKYEITELTSTTTTPTEEEEEEGNSGAGALTLAAAALVAVMLN